jgi:hypothetical protein
MLSRLASLASASQELIARRVVQSLQWTANTIGSAVDLTPGRRAEIAGEIEVTASMLRAQELLSVGSMPSPSRRRFNLSQSLREVASVISKRGFSLTGPELTDCYVSTSRPLVVTALFDLVFNACLFAEPADASVSLKVGDVHWTVEVANTSQEEIPVTWPVLGYRGPHGYARHPSGQGLGCWLALAVARTCNLRLWWVKEGGRWISRLEGAKA